LTNTFAQANCSDSQDATQPVPLLSVFPPPNESIAVPLLKRSPALGLAMFTLVGLVGIQTPAEASTVTVNVREHDTVRVIDGLTISRISGTVGSASTVRGQVLRVPASSFMVAPRAARDTMIGLETNQALALRQRDKGAVVGINGGYWLSRPTGVPNGLHVEDGRMTAGHAAYRSGTRLGRGSVGFRTDGSLVFDRLATTVTLTIAEDTVTLDEFNRHPRTTTDGTRAVTGELILFDDRYGGSINVPAGGIVVTLDQLAMATNSASQATITSVTPVFADTAVRVNQGGGLLIAYGDKTPLLQSLAAGTQATLTSQINPYETPQDAWSGLRHAVAGGPHLIGNGQIRSLTAWREEGFSETHLTGRQPRTAIGQTADGTVLLVTIDGRQPGWSNGVNLRELAQILLDLGALDAINLDGGGSTVMTSNADIVNRPSETRRSVANGLFVYAPLPNPARGTALACGTQLATSPFFDIASSVHVQAISCLSQYAITSGVTETLYMPQETVTRGQMATFLSAFIDEMSARGGRSLPQVTTSTFSDVSASNVHKANIERLAAAGILTGKTATTFGPHEPVTRGQTARMISETTRFITGKALPSGRDTFSDDTDNVHEDPINRLNGVRVIAGVGGFAYSPHASVTRGAMASFLMRTTDYLIDSGALR